MADLPPEQNKILVLEGALIPADWRLGMLHNDFARRLRDLDGEIRKVKNLWVLSACDVDQLCWTSEGLGRSAFHHFMIEALRGAAAGRDGRLTLEDLYKYVRTNVRDWAWNARGAIQEPVLLPLKVEGGEGAARAERTLPSQVHLATVEAASATEPLAPLERDAVERSWKGFRQLDRLEPHPSLYSPRRWREYRACLVRHEELIRARATSDQVRPIELRLGTLENLLRDERFLMKLPESYQNTLATDVIRGGSSRHGLPIPRTISGSGVRPPVPTPPRSGRRSWMPSRDPVMNLDGRCGAWSTIT